MPDTGVGTYGGKPLVFGPDYFIPKPFDPRVLWWVAPAVAEAAMASGVARYSVLRSQREIMGAFGSRAWIEFIELR